LVNAPIGTFITSLRFCGLGDVVADSEVKPRKPNEDQKEKTGLSYNERIASTREFRKEYREVQEDAAKALPAKTAPLPPPPLIGKPVETSSAEPSPKAKDDKKQ
jgi:hypothetical protein